MTQANTHVLLIGIDYYLPNRLSNGAVYKNLQGAVRDVNLMEGLFKERLKVPEDNIIKLTSSIPLNQSSEANDQLPTYENIVNSFHKIINTASEGDSVYIHYSGHGGRTRTIIPEEKGENGTDESLVPVDIGEPDESGNSPGRYLRDIEIAKLLQIMVEEHKLNVTMILDSCHSGGTTRGNGDIRGLDQDLVDDTPRPSDSLVDNLDELARNWNNLGGSNTRSLNANWLPESKDYVLIAACRANELAREYDFKLNQRNGALTYWLHDSLQQQNSALTYKDLYDRIYGKIRSQFSSQTPIIMGEGNRKVFSSELVKNYTYAVPVIEIENGKVILEVGETTGSSVGDRFAIYPQSVRDFSKHEARIAIATIENCGSTQSTCALEAIEGKQKVEMGDKAIPISVSTDLVREVRLYKKTEAELSENELTSEILNIQESALQAIADSLPENGWVELASEDSEESDISYQVDLTVDTEAENKVIYQICDRLGTPIPHLRPPIKVKDPEAAKKIVARLIHLSKYHTISELDNFDRTSPLLNKIKVEFLGKRKKEEYSPSKPIPKKSKLTKLEDPNNPTIEGGDWIFLRVSNNSNQDLNFAVMDLASDWSVEQVHPPKSEKFITLSPGQKEDFALPSQVPNDYEEDKDIIKVFATMGAANYGYLQLDSLDQPLKRNVTTRSPKGLNPFEDFLSAIDEEKPQTRKLEPSQNPSREWTTKQIELTVIKSKNKSIH